MVRVGGMAYTCAPAESIGKRISELKLDNGRPIEAGKSYGGRLGLRQRADRRAGVGCACGTPARRKGIGSLGTILSR